MTIFHTTSETTLQQTNQSDYDLLTAFIATQSEAAFADILKRYEQLVHTVCWRLLEDRNDVDDAFQATFLILIKNASHIRNRSALSAWLYGVAHRTAVRIATRKRRIALLEVETLENIPEPDNTSLVDLGEVASRQFFDEELERLPEKYRVVLVQHYLMEKSCREIAEDLGVSIGTVEGRVKRGKHALRIRLLKQGIGLSVISAFTLFAQQTASAATPQSLLHSTLEIGLEGLRDEPALFPSTEVNQLVSMEIPKMTAIKLTLVSTCFHLFPFVC